MTVSLEMKSLIDGFQSQLTTLGQQINARLDRFEVRLGAVEDNEVRRKLDKIETLLSEGTFAPIFPELTAIYTLSLQRSIPFSIELNERIHAVRDRILQSSEDPAVEEGRYQLADFFVRSGNKDLRYDVIALAKPWLKDSDPLKHATGEEQILNKAISYLTSRLAARQQQVSATLRPTEARSLLPPARKSSKRTIKSPQRQSAGVSQIANAKTRILTMHKEALAKLGDAGLGDGAAPSAKRKRTGE